ncbi:hypothetical protein C7S15_0349 [Burkholderia cepacia]|nr:hypothetical protein [Burkholderia cepacia]
MRIQNLAPNLKFYFKSAATMRARMPAAHLDAVRAAGAPR